jgi:S1-C subfamily serine protease
MKDERRQRRFILLLFEARRPAMSVLIGLLLSGVGPADAGAFPKRVQKAALAATARVTNVTQGTQGSGAILKKSGPFVYVLTANHVLEGGKTFEVAVYSPRSRPRPSATYRAIKVLARSVVADLAVLRVSTADAVPGTAPVCPARLIPELKNVAALTVGCEGGKAPTCAMETVVGKRRLRKPGARATAYYWETKRPPLRGRSGGPLFDRRGFLIGLASGAGDGKGYYSHAEEVHAFLRSNGLRWLTR